MWDRLRTGGGGGGGNNYGGGSNPSMSSSARPPPHKHMDPRDAYYSGANPSFAPAGKGSYSYSVQGGPAPPRPPRFREQQSSSEQHQHHNHHQQQQHHHAPPPRNPQRTAYRDSTARPPSSVYSQPSPLNTNFHIQQNRRTHEAEDVSPPSSPEILTPRDGFHRPPSPDISPIDEDPSSYMMSQSDAGHNGPQGRSNIPMMRRERRQNQDAAARTLRETRSKDKLRPQQQQQSPQQYEQQQRVPGPQMLSRRGYQGGEVRWDPRTGELTSSDKGRPSQVKPAEYAKGLGISGNSPQGQASREREPPRAGASNFGDRMRNIASGGPVDKTQEPLHQLQSSTDPAANAFRSDRPAWQGASGRTAIVDPVKDTKSARPLMDIPRKSSKRAHTTAARSSSGAGGPVGGLDTIMASPPVSPPPGGETLGRETIRQVVPSSQLPKQPPPQQVQASSYPSPPLSGDHTAANINTPASQRHQLNPSSSSPSTNLNQIKRKPTHQQQDSESSVYSQSDPYNYRHYAAAGDTAEPPKPPPHLEWTQPPSRFSVTTYDATPRESLDGFNPRDAPPVPETPEMFRSSPNARDDQPSVLERGRPPKLGHIDSVRGAGNEPIVISLNQSWHNNNNSSPPQRDRKPVGGSNTTPVGRASTLHHLDDRASTFSSSRPGSLHKMLPPAPPETGAKDRVAQLNAQLAGLAQRRVNITRSIKQMTELMPTDNILASAEVIHKREMEKRKVEGLKTELSEVQREEYELGLKLHRAYKRMDRDAEFEPTTLWVRRVTG